MLSRLYVRSTGIGLALWLLPTFAYAQTSGLAASVSWGVTWMISALNLATWIVFILLNQLLDTSVFLDPNMLAMLNKVWVLSRDLMNILFAFILVGAAVYTVVTAKKDFIAEHLKKFVLAVVLVNFSWFIPQVILDVGNIAATTVFDIPSLLGQTNAACTYRSPKIINGNGITCTDLNTTPKQYMCDCAAVVDAKFFVTNPVAATLTAANGWNPILGNTLFIRLTSLSNLQNVAPSSVILNGLIINHARLAGLASVPPSSGGTSVQALIMFLLQEAVVLLIHIALLFPLAAMMLAFAIRIPVIWLTMAFMPFMVLKFVVPEQYTGEYPQKIWDHFLKAAFLPAIVGIPLTVGFIMINAGQQAKILSGMQGMSFPLTGNISDYLELMWLIMTLGIIWVGVFSTLEKMGVMAMGSQAIKGAGESLGRIAVKAPLSIPLPSGLSPLAMMRSLNPRRIESAIDNNTDLKSAFDSLRKGGGGDKIEDSAKKHAADAGKLQNLDKDIKELTKAIEDDKKGSTKATQDHVEAVKLKISSNLGIDKSDVNSGGLKRFIKEGRGVSGAKTSELNTLDSSTDALKKVE